MDLESHLVAYRDHLSKTALEGCENYAKIIRTRDNRATAADYLTYFRNKTQAALEEKNQEKYALSLTAHQNGMLALFDRMLRDDLWDFVDLKEYQLLELVRNRGWKWLRYVPFVVDIDYDLGEFGSAKISVIPNYSERFKMAFSSGRLVFDAEEMSFLEKWKGTALPMEVIKEKKESPRIKVLEDGTFRPVDQNNTKHQLLDWALPLGLG